MTHFLKLWTFLGLSFLLVPVHAQHAQHAELEESHGKETGIYEIIVTGIYAYAFEQEEGTWGNELHFTYWFTHSYGAGFSYTLKYEEEETLNDLAVLGSWNPTKWVTFNAGPNFAFASEHRDFAVLLYLESEINVRPTEWFHFGPVLGTLIGNSSEISGGFHLGVEF